MIQNNKNRSEILLTAIFVGLFLFVLTALNNHNYSNSSKSINDISVCELNDLAGNAIINNANFIPDFNKSWITSDNSGLKFNSDNKLSVFLSNSRFKIKLKTNIKSYLSIKEKTYEALKSFNYSSQISTELPPIS